MELHGCAKQFIADISVGRTKGLTPGNNQHLCNLVHFHSWFLVPKHFQISHRIKAAAFSTSEFVKIDNSMLWSWMSTIKGDGWVVNTSLLLLIGGDTSWSHDRGASTLARLVKRTLTTPPVPTPGTAHGDNTGRVCVRRTESEHQQEERELATCMEWKHIVYTSFLPSPRPCDPSRVKKSSLSVRQ